MSRLTASSATADPGRLTSRTSRTPTGLAALPTGALAPGLGPLLTPAEGHERHVSLALQRAWHRGELVRLRPGIYASLARWREAPPWDRYTLAVAAVACRRPNTVFTGLTAAHVHGLWLSAVPREIEYRASAHHHGRQPLTSRPLPTHVSDSVWLPQRRPRHHVPSALDEPSVSVRLRLSDGTDVGHARADSLPTVQLVVATGYPLQTAVAPLDALARQHPGPSSRWAEQAEEALRNRAETARFHRQWGFADAWSESAGESWSRALIHDLGFAAPQLQHTHADEEGRFVARTDFWWGGPNVVGEFDGITKYDVGLYSNEAERRRAIREEKEREVRLQRLGLRVVRWTWSDLHRPAELAAALHRAGVPRQ
ncbi:MAG: hypothetical protein Q4G34_03360 [Micrococcus sp.]|nr:hypothetical protein [Micrococcus sp.]